MVGLSSEQVSERIARGEVNISTQKNTKISAIIKKHALTLFNIVILVLAILVFIFGKKRDALFLVVAVAATVIAIINDVRAKIVIDKLNLVSEKPATVIRDDKELKISPERIVKGDAIKFTLGDQIVVDSVIVEGVLEVNESFLTGESDNIQKKAGDRLLSGSFVVSGECLAQVTAVGDDNSITKTLVSARQIKNTRSQIFRTMDKVIRVGTVTIIPVGILLFLKQYFLGAVPLGEAVTSTVAALVSMMPEGLILLTSSVLALGSIRLAKKRVLVQDFYSIETLARVDVVCLDKTGTITTGKLKVERLEPAGEHTREEMKEVIRTINGALGEANATAKALAHKFGSKKTAEVSEYYHFSSEKKYSGVRVGDVEYLMGAYDFVARDKSYKKTELEYASEYRVLTLIKREGDEEEVLGFVLLSDEVRKNAKQLLGFFEKNDTEVKVISGDGLPTVTKVLAKVGMSDPKAVDLSAQENVNYAKMALEYDVFARVLPEQKKLLVQALKTAGKTVAMTGDGVNDCLALKEADCGISIGDGSDASRRTANIVLLDNDFSAIPSVITEGYITINNITRSSALFLSKTIFATVLSVIFIFVNLRYPFSPVEMSLINFVMIGAPSFLLALEPNTARPTISIKKHIINNSVPAAMATIFTTIALACVASAYNYSWGETLTFSCILTCYVGFLLIFKVSRPLNKYRGVLLATLVGVISLVLILPSFREFFSLSALGWEQILWVMAIGGVATLIFVGVSRFLSHREV